MSLQSIQDGNGTHKKPKNDEDFISDLPEHIIGHILAFMPTKDAVRTSTLSKDWEHKWTSVERIDIDDTVLYAEHDFKEDFIAKYSTRVILDNFVERVLLNLHNVTSCCVLLSSHVGYNPERVAAWICKVSTDNVKSLKVDHFWGENVALPHSLLLNGSLRNLELHLRCTFKVPSMISYPNLRNLNLSRFEIINESSTSNILTLAFPVLETFKLDACRFLNVKIVEVHAPELTTFHRTFSTFSRRHTPIPDDYSIKVVSEKLVDFKFSSDFPRKYILVGQKVVHATLIYAMPVSEEEVKANGIHAKLLLQEFSNLQELNIWGFLTMEIAQSAAGVSFPVLHHLVRLIVSGQIYAKGVLGLLQVTPNFKCLKLLTLSVFHFIDYDCNAVDPVPPCLKDHLEEFEYGDFGERSLDSNLVNFLLNNGRVLKKVQCVHPLWIE